MFVSGIEISDHNQFKNFKLDLTYPKGHDKEGKPLDKVCFIGQSGTGKTTLLEEIWTYPNHPKMKPQRYTHRVENFTSFLAGCLYSDNGILLDTKKALQIPSVFFTTESIQAVSRDAIFLDKITLFPFKSYIDNYNSGWSKFKDKIIAHQNQKIKYNAKIANAFMKEDIEEAEEYARELKEWQVENDTPLEDLANKYLNPLLKDFNLEVKLDFESLEEVEKIHLINKTTQQVIPMEHWSSGVENIISRTLPLYTYKFKNSIICVDEPENSLYPDVQRKIIDIYTKLAPDSQFFFATHSPIIASSFEPWEIVELKFDEEGYVYRELYYEGNNHVDNYKYYPQYLRWDAILQNIFDLENDGSEERQELLQKFSNLDTQLKARKAKGEQLSKEDPDVQKLMEMGKKLGWNTKKG